MELLYSNVVKGTEKGIQGFQIYYLSSSNEIKIDTNRGKSKKVSLNTGFTYKDLHQSIYDILEENTGIGEEIYEAYKKIFDSLYKIKKKENEILFEVSGSDNIIDEGNSIVFTIKNEDFFHRICIPYESRDIEEELDPHLYITREKLVEKYDIVFAIDATERIRNALKEIIKNLTTEDFSYIKTISVPKRTKDNKSDIILKALDFYSKYIERKEEKKEEKYKEYYRYQDTTINLNIDYTAEVYTDPEIEGGYVFELSVGKDSTLIHLYKGSETNDEMLEAIFVIFTNRLRSRGVIEIDKSDFIKAKEFFLKMYKLLLQ